MEKEVTFMEMARLVLIITAIAILMTRKITAILTHILTTLIVTLIHTHTIMTTARAIKASK